jgi:site-specific DNA-methyltransferase (adenine-specific)
MEKIMSVKTIIQGDNLEVLDNFGDNWVDLIYIDPPWNTGKIQKKITKEFVQDKDGSIKGFKNKRYNSIITDEILYNDCYSDYIAFLKPRIVEARRILSHNGSIFVHINEHEEAYVKIMLDKIFGRENFKRQIIHSWDYGGKPKTTWPLKHSSILWYVKDKNNYTFNYEEIDRIPYKVPKLAGEEKAKKGKIPTSVWELGIVGTNSNEKTGYPNQKNIKLIERIIKVHSNPGDIIIDFFAGSGTVAEVAFNNKRSFFVIDNNPEAIKIMKERLAFCEPKVFIFDEIKKTS